MAQENTPAKQFAQPMAPPATRLSGCLSSTPDCRRMAAWIGPTPGAHMWWLPCCDRNQAPKRPKQQIAAAIAISRINQKNVQSHDKLRHGAVMIRCLKTCTNPGVSLPRHFGQGIFAPSRARQHRLAALEIPWCVCSTRFVSVAARQWVKLLSPVLPDPTSKVCATSQHACRSCTRGVGGVAPRP